MANGHGGARPGAGRKRKDTKFAAQIGELEARIADRLPRILENTFLLADGGIKLVKARFEPAGLIQITKEIATKEGMVNVKELAFPHLDPEALVCVYREESITGPNLAANQYLIDRIAGKPTLKVEAEVDVDGFDITEQVRAAAEQELGKWRKQMTEQLSNTLNAPPMPPTSATNT